MKLHEYLGCAHMIEYCPPAEAEGSHFLRNHGYDIGYDPTVWAKRAKTHRYTLTTGGRDKKNIEIDGYLKLLVAIFVDLPDPDNYPEHLRAEIRKSNYWILRWRAEAKARTEGKL